MERAVPRVESDETALYLRTIYSLLRSSAEVQIRTLEEVHAGMNSLLHNGARADSPDMSAFIYCLLRLPSVMSHVRLVVLGQSPGVFAEKGFGTVEDWEALSAPARRRRCFFDGQETLACLIASRSDIDDVVPMLTAYQIEWNKLHRLLRHLPQDLSLPEVERDAASFQALAAALQMHLNDLEHLKAIWGASFAENLGYIARQCLKLRVQLLSGSLSAYRRATHAWWQRIETAKPEVNQRPVYFVSSNTHSLVNILTGFALQHQEELLEFVSGGDDQDLIKEWEDIQAQDVPSSRENFFYYVLKKYLHTPQGHALRQARQAQEQACCIHRINSEHSFDLDAQLIALNGIDPEVMDPRLRRSDHRFLHASDALILNIDYPLGMAAYEILREVSEHVGEVLGVYILGKAATLNGVVGDVMIPNVVFDGHTNNTYMFDNCFQATEVAPYLVYGTVLDNQKSVTVPGTFLQNAEYIDVFYREGYTDIEMEAGPYLSAVYEMFRPKRHPMNEIVSLHNLPFDLGMLHYASDKPMSKGKNLGAGSMSYFGMDPTYATTLATLRRILALESHRVAGGEQQTPINTELSTRHD